jgi:hypothetical protein
MNGLLTQPSSPPSLRPQSTGRAPKAQADSPNGTVKRMRPRNRRSSGGSGAAAAARRGGKLPGSRLASTTPLTSADVSASEDVSSDQSTGSDSPEESDSSRQQRFQNVDPGNQYEQVRPFLLSHFLRPPNKNAYRSTAQGQKRRGADERYCQGPNRRSE